MSPEVLEQNFLFRDKELEFIISKKKLCWRLYGTVLLLGSPVPTCKRSWIGKCNPEFHFVFLFEAINNNTSIYSYLEITVPVGGNEEPHFYNKQGFEAEECHQKCWNRNLCNEEMNIELIISLQKLCWRLWGTVLLFRSPVPAC